RQLLIPRSVGTLVSAGPKTAASSSAQVRSPRCEEAHIRSLGIPLHLAPGHKNMRPTMMKHILALGVAFAIVAPAEAAWAGSTPGNRLAAPFPSNASTAR